MTTPIAFRPPPGVWRGIDTAGDDDSPGNVITAELARALYAEGYRWVARYFRLDGQVPPRPVPGGEYGPGVADGCWPLSLAESDWILGNGLGIVPVQFASFGTAAHGSRTGKAMVSAARLLGWPTGIHLFGDVEGDTVAAASPARVRAYIEAQAAAVLAGGQLGALYGTGELPLTGREWYGLRGVTCYWGAAGPQPPNPYPRMFSIEQDPPTAVCGILCDTNTMRPDRFGQMPSIVATPEIAAAWYGEALGQLTGSPWLTP